VTGAAAGPLQANAAAARRLTIALPKGRTLGTVAKLLSRAGVVAQSGGPPAPIDEALREDSRALVRHARLGPHALSLLLLKPDDVPTYVEYGAADLGVCGRDILFEREVDVYHAVDLGIGRCRLVVAGPRALREPTVAAATPSTRMPRVATKYPRSAAWHFARRGVQVEIVNVQGSVEIAPLTGLADLIVDLVETGKTLDENGLEVTDEILPVTSIIVANRASYKLRSEPIAAFLHAVRDALATPMPAP
jgi:ATP phosphoribosyltransferase